MVTWMLLCMASLAMVLGGAGAGASLLEHDARSVPADLLLRLYCPSDLVSPDQLAACTNTTLNTMRGYKLASFYNLKRRVEAAFSGLPDEDIPAYKAFIAEESSLPRFHRKITIAQDVADHSTVSRICVVGMRGGLSVTNFLVANPTAQIVVFDALNHAKFGVAHFQHIVENHPNRAITLIAGNPARSIRDYATQFPGRKCQVLFLDDLGPPEQIPDTIAQALALADPTFNRVLINDFQQQEVSTAFHYVQQKVRLGLLCPTCTAFAVPSETTPFTYAVRSDVSVVAHFRGFLPTPCVAMYKSDEGGQHMEFLFALENCVAADTELPPQPSVDDSVELLVAQVSTGAAAVTV